MRDLCGITTFSSTQEMLRYLRGKAEMIEPIEKVEKPKKKSSTKKKTSTKKKKVEE